MYGHPEQGYMPDFKPGTLIKVYEKNAETSLRTETENKPSLPPHVAALMRRINCEGCE